MNRVTKSALLGATMLGLGSAAYAQATVENAEALDPNATIAENAMKVQNFSTLIAAVQAAGLDEALMGPGPYTVFAPIDSAFAALPEGTVEDLLLPENRERLTTILEEHVVPGVYTAGDIDTAILGEDEMEEMTGDVRIEDGVMRIETLSGFPIFLQYDGSTLTVSGDSEGAPDASIIAADIQSSNGVIHVIDGVVMPEPTEG